MRITIIATAFLSALWAAPTAADDVTAEFIRFHKLARAEAQLQTSICHYRHPETDRVVSLVSAVHVGDSQYYRDLQRHLDGFDLVLFERVGTPEERDDEAAARLSVIGELQMQLGELLEFTHQMQGLDYERKNLRHADMTLAAFTAALDERGESLIPAEGLLRLFAPLMRMSLAMQQAMKELDPQMTNRMRWQMGGMLADVERLLERMGIRADESPDDVIIGVRNEHAWSIFEEALPEGHRRVAIFYGAAHMPDFHRRLVDGGWKLERCEWVSAWYIPTPEPEAAEPEGSSGSSPSSRVRDADL